MSPRVRVCTGLVALRGGMLLAKLPKRASCDTNTHLTWCQPRLLSEAQLRS